MASTEDQLPTSIPGLTVRLAGESLETVTTKSGDFRLLAAASNLEMISIRLSPGKRIFLVPFDDGVKGAVEMYFIVSGFLEAVLPSGPLRVGAGATLVSRDLAGPVNFQATSDVELLYVTTQPTFHQVSHELKELMDLAMEVEMKDGYTAQHCLRLQQLSYATGQEMGMSHHDLHYLEYGSYLHDVGKARVPVQILQKPGPLTAEEWAVMRMHPTYGREMLDATFMREAGRIVEQHHERLDGSGYPGGLSGSAVAVEASIVAVADTYDAITTDRPYRKGAPREVAFAEIEKGSGKHFPPAVVRAFFRAVTKISP